MYEQTLARAGLTGDQAKVYEILLKHGVLPAGKASTYAGLKRGLTYKILGELETLGLVAKHEKSGAVARFEAAHPLKLKDLADQKAREAEDAHVALEGVLGTLVSDFNLASGKPGIQFFEGLGGVKKVLDDSLTSKTEIYSYADIEAIVKYIDTINTAYAAKREKLGIKKRGIFLDTPFARKYLADYHAAVTETRFIHYDAPPFQTIMQIYDGKISYITLQPQKMIGVIIADQHIYEMHKYLFEYLWGTASPATLPPPQQ